MNKILATLLFVIVLFLSACNIRNVDTNGTVVARVGTYYLYESDMQGVIPANTPAKDSLVIARNFINTWIREKLLLIQAEKNLSIEQMDFTKQLETYRNSLIIYQYESLLISQQMDTEVSDAEIEDYYDKNRQNFALTQNIVKADYVIIDKNSPYINKIKNYLKSDDYNLIDSLETYCELYAERYFINEDQWMPFNDILSVIPIQTYDQEAFLKDNRFYEFTQASYQYFVKFLEFSVKDNISPLGFERENIRRIILNKRKIDLINKMHNQLFEDALNSDIVEIY